MPNAESPTLTYFTKMEGRQSGVKSVRIIPLIKIWKAQFWFVFSFKVVVPSLLASSAMLGE